MKSMRIIIAGVLLLIAPGFLAERSRLRPGYDSNYDPRAMAQFFEKLQAVASSRGSEFFSDHPNPGNRVESVNEEIRKLGGARSFKTIRRIFSESNGP